MSYNRSLHLGNLDDTKSGLLLRRRHQQEQQNGANYTINTNTNEEPIFCNHCQDEFEPGESMLSSKGSLWHQSCFVCAQCFQPFPDEVFFEVDGRNYCEHDFQMLYAPFCAKCGEFITGRVIKAMASNWHPDCFACELCGEGLAETGFNKYLNRALCRECHAREKDNLGGRYICHKCRGVIEEGQHLKVKGDFYHPYHFNCSQCCSELNADAKEKNGELFCLRCFDKMGIPICGACRRPVEERVVHALGKAWHVEHFVCAVCERPFLGSKYFELNGKAYCNLHYQQRQGNLCGGCNRIIQGGAVEFTRKVYCLEHFTCCACDHLLDQKAKIYELDLKPICKACLERLPHAFRKHLAKMHKLEKKAGNQ